MYLLTVTDLRGNKVFEQKIDARLNEKCEQIGDVVVVTQEYSTNPKRLVASYKLCPGDLARVVNE